MTRPKIIARIFRELKQTEQWGSGIQRIMKACSEAGLEYPRFEEVSNNRFRVTLYRKRIKPIYLDETDRKILDLLKQEGPLSTKFIAQHIGLTERSIRPRLTKLIEKGKVKAIGRSHKDPHKKYGIVEGST